MSPIKINKMLICYVIKISENLNIKHFKILIYEIANSK